MKDGRLSQIKAGNQSCHFEAPIYLLFGYNKDKIVWLYNHSHHLSGYIGAQGQGNERHLLLKIKAFDQENKVQDYLSIADIDYRALGN